MTSSGSPEPEAAGAVAGVCRLAYDLRLIAVALTIASLPAGAGRVPPELVVALLAALVASFVPLLWWRRFGPLLMRHPTYLAADTVLATFVLAVAGTESPFFYFTLGSALLAGLLYGWRGAALLSALLVLAAWWVFWIRQPYAPAPSTFQGMVGLPALYPITAAAGAALRRLLRQQAATAAALADLTRLSAAADERARLAREMHDSVTKTLHGIALSASALAGTVARSPAAAEQAARNLAAAARQAAAEARSLIVDLRADQGSASLDAAVRAAVAAWRRDSGLSAAVVAQPTEVASPAARYELLCVLREALANVARHAGAGHVRVELAGRDGEVVLTVADDGAGFVVPDDLADLASAGHFGLVGMRERAARAGGRLDVASGPGTGTVVSLVVPAGPGEDLRPGRRGGPVAVGGEAAPP